MTKTLKTFLAESRYLMAEDEAPAAQLPQGGVAMIYNHEKKELRPGFTTCVFPHEACIDHHYARTYKNHLFVIRGTSGEVAQHALRAYLGHHGVHASEVPKSEVYFVHPAGHADENKNFGSVQSFLTHPEEPKW